MLVYAEFVFMLYATLSFLTHLFVFDFDVNSMSAVGSRGSSRGLILLLLIAAMPNGTRLNAVMKMSF